MPEPISAVNSTSAQSTPPSSAGRDYQVQRGDTLGELAARYGTDVDTLARLNGITNPDRILAGQTITVPDGGNSHTVQRGDTLSAIATANGTSVDALMRANPEIRNANRIYPDQVVRLPAGNGAAPANPSGTTGQVGATGATTGVQETSMQGGRLSLSQTDIDNIKKTLQTEWVPNAGNAQAAGIVDTILNRTASGRWGSTVADVVNARQQFSDINGPVSRRQGRDSVDDIPMSRVSQRVSDFVDSYLAQRASGTPSSVGSHLNYANPNYSDQRNMGWIMALDGPVLGSGRAIHRHGTTPDLERHRPGEFAVALPGSANSAAAQQTPDQPNPARTSGTINGNDVAAANGVSVKNASVRLTNLDASMGPVISAVAQAARRLGLPTPVITSGNDSSHMNGSLHYENQALDFRGNNITDAQGRALEREVRAMLGSQYDVHFEIFNDRPSNDHLHVEFDPN